MIDIWLTITAWRKGWGWKALIPFVMLFFAFTCLSVVAEMTGRTRMDFWLVYVLAGIVYLAALIVMASKSVGHEKVPSYKQIKNLGRDDAPKRAISSYGG